MDVMTWLKENRKLDAGLLTEMGVITKEHSNLGQVAAFPYLRDGKVYAAKFRTVDKKFISTKGQTRDLYNADALLLDQEQPIIITEGEIDCLSVIQAGFSRAVSLPDGWTEQGNKTESLVAAIDALKQSPWVVVAGDSDKAGESLPAAVSNILDGHDVRYVTWPETCKDANDVLIKFGEAAIVECLNKAKRIDPVGGVITGFSDMPPISQQRVLKIGKDPFDQAIALELGEMSVWTGLPGYGKSTLITWVGDEVSKNEGIRVGNIGFETHPFRIRDQLSRSNTRKAWSELNSAEREELQTDLDKRWRLVHLSGDETENNLSWLNSMIRALAIRDGCKLIVIDPWNELEHLPEVGESMTQYINFALKYVRRIARNLGVHIALVAHPTKIKSDGKPRAPTGYDVADSAAFFNKPGLGITVHPADEPHIVQIINWKTRDTMLYKVRRCSIKVEFAEAWGLYRQIGEPSMPLTT